jgi:hypothetical protein
MPTGAKRDFSRREDYERRAIFAKASRVMHGRIVFDHVIDQSIHIAHDGTPLHMHERISD